MSFTPEHCRAARALLGWSQAQLAEVSKVATKTIADFEREERTPYKRTLAELESALRAAGLDFTNGGRPGVRTTPLWALHRVARRANLEAVLRIAGREGLWKIVRTPTGLECWNQHGERMGSVEAGSLEAPKPVFDPPVDALAFPDRATPADLQFWITEMGHRDAQRGPTARHRDPQTVKFPDDFGPSKPPA
jgi:transcriptional regulator with XRE-family HTH domain